MSLNDKPSVALRIAAAAVVALAGVALFEVVARVFYANGSGIVDFYRDRFKPVMVDQPYKILDESNRALWKLRPATDWTFKSLRADMNRRGAILGLHALGNEGTNESTANEDQIAFRTNSLGFKGPELRSPRPSIRVLALGDSCTFGTMDDEKSYPRSLERQLRALGYDVEVINGGVEGYSPRHVRYRLPEFKSLGADFTILYVGWNELFAEPPAVGIAKYLRSLWLLDRFRERLHVLLHRFSRESVHLVFFRTKKPLTQDPLIEALRNSQPAFIGQVEEILVELEASGSTPILATLPGLYRVNEMPSEKALTMGHLPLYTDNPLVFASYVSRYNALLRELAHHRGWKILDLEAWSEERLNPPDQYFFDSVHLTNAGQTKLGEHAADRLIELFRERAIEPFPKRAR